MAIYIPLAKEYVFERRARRVIFLIIGLCAVGYIYFVSTSVLYIIARKDAHTQISQVESQVATLESEYFVLSSTISIEEAEKLGLVSVSKKNFVTRTSVHASLSEVASNGL